MCGFRRSATCARHPSCPEPPHRSRRPPGILTFSLRNRGQTQHFRQSTLRGCRDETSLSSRKSMQNLRQSQQLEEDEVEKETLQQGFYIATSLKKNQESITLSPSRPSRHASHSVCKWCARAGGAQEPDDRIKRRSSTPHDLE